MKLISHIRKRLLYKLILLFSLIIIIPSGLIFLFVSHLISENYDNNMRSQLDSGKEFIYSIFDHNKSIVSAGAIKINDDSVYLTKLKQYLKTGNVTENRLSSYSKLNYDLDFYYILDKDRNIILFDSKTLKRFPLTASNRIAYPVICYTGKDFVCYTDLDIRINEEDYTLVIGKMIDKFLIHEFCKMSGIDFTLLKTEGDSLTNIYTTIFDDYGYPLEKGVISLSMSDLEKPGFFSDFMAGDTKRICFPQQEHFEDGYNILLSKTEDTSLMVSTRNMFIIMFFVFLFLMGIMWLFIRINIINPVERLLEGIGEASEQITNNRPIRSIEISNSDEIGMLADKFNEISSRLGQSFSRIKYLQNYLLNIIESMSSGLIAVDNKGRITQWNRSALDFKDDKDGLTKGNFIWSELDSLGLKKDEILKIIGSSEHIETGKNTVIKNDKRNLNIHFYPLSDDGAQGSVIRIDDITELKRQEDQLRQAQKMETIGTLAGGIAHDFNNILSGIVGVVSILKYKAGKGIPLKELEEYLDIMEKSGERAGDIVQRLLTLSKKQNTSFESVDVTEVIDQIVSICKNTFDKSVTIEKRFESENSTVYADFTQLEQAILNLSINSYHAMTVMRPENQIQGGELIVSVQDPGNGEMNKYINNKDKREFLKISVKDTGVGMDTSTLRQIFEPFFSTKDKNTGTGLGLTIVQNIIQQFGGFIDIDTEPGKGTEFSIFIPKYDNTDEKEYIGKKVSIKKGSGTVLVIDDEPVLRELARSMLEQAGYEVITASDGFRGIEIYNTLNDSVVIILLDMVLPGINGKETYQELKKINKDLKVIVTSGFAKDSRVEALLKLGAQDFIQKPFTIYSLSEKIYQVLFKGEEND